MPAMSMSKGPAAGHNRSMGLLERIFKPHRDKDADASVPASVLADSIPPQEEARAPRRELLQVVMLATMRSHGVPSDWIECRVLPARSRRGPGMHVHFVVRKAHAQLLPHLLAFQQRFQDELLQYEPRAQDWLLGLAWQFEDVAPVESRAVPAAAAAPAAAEDDLESDLQALFAIRDQALAQTGAPRDGAAAPGAREAPPRPGGPADR